MCEPSADAGGMFETHAFAYGPVAEASRGPSKVPAADVTPKLEPGSTGLTSEPLLSVKS